MSDCEKIKALLLQYTEGECSDEIKTAVEDHLSTCPKCKKEIDEMTDELPPLPIALPDAKQINPFKRIKKKNRIRNTIIISIISVIVIMAAIIITKYVKYKNGSLVYCQDNPIVVLEAIADSFTNSDDTPNLSIVLSQNEGNILNNDNHYFEIYDEDRKQYYRVSDEEIGSFHNICVRITPISKDNTSSDRFSLLTTIKILKSVLDQEDIDENKMSITLYTRNNIPEYNVEYYYNALNNSFTDAADFSKYADKNNVCIIQLMEPKVKVPEEGVIMGTNLKVISIAIIF